MTFFRFAAIPCLALATALTACNSSSRTTSDPAVSRVSFSLEPSTRDLVAGETVTIFARTQDTYGRDPQITWTSTGGSLDTEQSGRVARVKFNEAGTYVVSAVLTAEGREIKRESVEIRVKPLS